MPPRGKKPPQRQSKANEACIYCGDIYNSRGIVQHERRCPERPEEPIPDIDDTAGNTDPGPGESGTSQGHLRYGQCCFDPKVADNEIQIAAIADDPHIVDSVGESDGSTSDGGEW